MKPAFLRLVLTAAVALSALCHGWQCPDGMEEVYRLNGWTVRDEESPLGLELVEVLGSGATVDGTDMLHDCGEVAFSVEGLNWTDEVLLWAETIVVGHWNGGSSAYGCTDYATFKSGNDSLLVTTMASGTRAACYPESTPCAASQSASSIAGWMGTMKDGASDGAVVPAARNMTVGSDGVLRYGIEFTHDGCQEGCHEESVGLGELVLCTWTVPTYTLVSNVPVLEADTGAAVALPVSVSYSGGTESSEVILSWSGGDGAVNETLVGSGVADLNALVLSHAWTAPSEAGTMKLNVSLLSDYGTKSLEVDLVVVTPGSLVISDCPEASPVQCNDVTCAVTAAECLVGLVVCDADTPVACADGQCMERAVDCLGFDNATVPTDPCPDGMSLCWRTGACASNCDALPGCGVERPVRCSDGSCVGESDTCPDVESCGEGLTRCEDGVCRNVSSNGCPEFNGCPLSEPVECPSGFCAESWADCASEQCESGVECWDGECKANATQCVPPPFDVEPIPVVIRSVAGNISVPSEGGEEVLSLAVAPCLSEDGGVLENLTLSVEPVARSRIPSGSLGQVRSSIVELSLWLGDSGAPAEDVGVGSVLAGLGLDFQRSLIDGESRSDLCIAGLSSVGEWVCILNSADLAVMMTGEDRCDTSAVRNYADSEEEVREFTTFTEVREDDGQEEVSDSLSDIILPASMAEVFLVLTLLLVAGIAFAVRLVRQLRKAKRAPVKAAKMHRMESAMSSAMASGQWSGGSMKMLASPSSPYRVTGLRSPSSVRVGLDAGVHPPKRVPRRFNPPN